MLFKHAVRPKLYTSSVHFLPKPNMGAAHELAPYPEPSHLTQSDLFPEHTLFLQLQVL